jgi:hypothetical protein
MCVYDRYRSKNIAGDSHSGRASKQLVCVLVCEITTFTITHTQLYLWEERRQGTGPWLERKQKGKATNHTHHV